MEEDSKRNREGSETMKECPVCGCKILVKTEGYLIYKYTCQNCGRWFVEPKKEAQP